MDSGTPRITFSNCVPPSLVMTPSPMKHSTQEPTLIGEEPKIVWGSLKGAWILRGNAHRNHPLRRAMVEENGNRRGTILPLAGRFGSKFYSWKSRVGQPNRHNATVPRTVGCCLGKRRESLTSKSGSPMKAIAV